MPVSGVVIRLLPHVFVYLLTQPCALLLLVLEYNCSQSWLVKKTLLSTGVFYVERHHCAHSVPITYRSV